MKGGAAGIGEINYFTSLKEKDPQRKRLPSVFLLRVFFIPFYYSFFAKAKAELIRDRRKKGRICIHTLCTECVTDLDQRSSFLSQFCPFLN